MTTPGMDPTLAELDADGDALVALTQRVEKLLTHRDAAIRHAARADNVARAAVELIHARDAFAGTGDMQAATGRWEKALRELRRAVNEWEADK